MDRRAYLTALGTAVAAVSGCSAGESQQSGTPTPTATPEPAPRIEDVGLLSERGAYDDIDADISGVGVGGELLVGTEYDVPVADGAVEGLVEARVSDDGGAEVATNTSEVDAVVDAGDRPHGRQSWFAFDTADWDRGSYTVEVLVNSQDYGTTASAETTAEVVAPLGEGEVALRLAEYPDEVVAGETFEWTLGIENLSDRDTTLVTDTVTIDPPGQDPVTLDNPYRLNVPAGEELLDEQEVRFPTWGRHTYRIDGVDAEFEFVVQAPEG